MQLSKPLPSTICEPQAWAGVVGGQCGGDLVPALAEPSGWWGGAYHPLLCNTGLEWGSLGLRFLFWATGASLVAQMVKNPSAMWETWVRSLRREDPLEEGMATHSSILAWRTPWTEEPGRLESMRVGHSWVTKSSPAQHSGEQKIHSKGAVLLGSPCLKYLSWEREERVVWVIFFKVNLLWIVDF